MNRDVEISRYRSRDTFTETAASMFMAFQISVFEITKFDCINLV